MKSDRVLEEIKDRIDIVDFISDYVQLRKAGQNWKGLCPFHTEKTPSFTVSPSKQRFHCFGCGAGGDVISFLEQYEHMPFPEALSVLAEKAGVRLKPVRQDRKAQEKDELVRNALRDAAEFFAQKLKQSTSAAAYVRKRGITEETAELFRLGYAPAGWHNLLQFMKGKGYAEAVLREAGLVVAGEKGMYDMFRDRIIFPIMGVQGSVIAFGARALDNSLPKYINSPETPVFRKSETLYGIYSAKEAVRQSGQVLLVEGYMDVIICHQYGIRNVVAPLGTALTAGHLQKIRRLVREAILVFDGDSAGIAAARRSLPLFCQNDVHVRVLLLPEGEDPDSYLRKHGSEAFGRHTEGAQSMIDFLLAQAKGRRSEAIREVLAAIAVMGDAIEAEQQILELAVRSRIPEATLRQELRKLKGKGSAPAQKTAAVRRTVPAVDATERLLLSAVIAFPEKAADVLNVVAPDDMRDETVAELFRKVAASGVRDALTERIEDIPEEGRLLMAGLSVEPGFDTDQVDRVIEDCLRAIAGRRLAEQLHRAREAGDLTLMHALLQEKKKNIKGKGHERV